MRTLETWLARVRRARGIADGHVQRLWGQLLSGQAGGRAPAGSGASTAPTAADHAWGRLMQLRAEFLRLDRMAALASVVTVAGGERPPASQAELAALKAGCAVIAVFLRHGRRSERLPAPL